MIRPLAILIPCAFPSLLGLRFQEKWRPVGAIGRRVNVEFAHSPRGQRARDQGVPGIHELFHQRNLVGRIVAQCSLAKESTGTLPARESSGDAAKPAAAQQTSVS